MLNGNSTYMEVCSIKLHRPANAGHLWHGTPHIVTLEAMEENAVARGYTLSNGRFALGRHGADLAAVFDIDIPGLPPPAALRWCVGVTLSNARKRVPRMVYGAVAWKSQTGYGHRMLELAKQVGGNDIDQSINIGMASVPNMMAEAATEIAMLRNTRLEEGAAEKLIVAAGRLGLMPWSRLEAVDRFYHGNQEPMAWRLAMAFGYVARRNPPMKQLMQLMKLGSLLRAAVRATKRKVHA